MKMISVMILAAATTASGCEQSAQPSAVERQRVQAARAVAIEQTYCYECSNIAKRRTLFGKPGVIGYIVLMNQAGQPIQYLTVDGKCTSASKRLTQPRRFERIQNYSGQSVTDDNILTQVDGPGEDGVYGSSEPYIYCFGADGRYVQWSGDYLYSDKPFDLTIKPLVIDTSAKLTAQ